MMPTVHSAQTTPHVGTCNQSLIITFCRQRQSLQLFASKSMTLLRQRGSSPSEQVSALDDSCQLPKVCNLAVLLPAGLHRLDQISQVDLCQFSQTKSVDVPVVDPLAELYA